MRTFFVFAFFCLFVAAGFRVAVDSWHGQVFVYMGEQRAPASVRSIRDYSALDRKALFTSVQKQMLADASANAYGGFVGVKLGHPLVKVAGGASEFACPVQGHSGLFDRVELTFIGTGVSESGEQPKMIVESDCLPGENLNTLAPIFIPMQDIVRAPAKDQEIQLFGEHSVVVRLVQIPSTWPRNWVLWNVKLFRQANPDESLNIGSAKIREAHPKLLSFDWQ